MNLDIVDLLKKAKVPAPLYLLAGFKKKKKILFLERDTHVCLSLDVWPNEVKGPSQQFLGLDHFEASDV